MWHAPLSRIGAVRWRWIKLAASQHRAMLRPRRMHMHACGECCVRGIAFCFSSAVGVTAKRGSPTPTLLLHLKAYKRVQSERRSKAVLPSIWSTPSTKLASVSAAIATKRASIFADPMASNAQEAAGSPERSKDTSPDRCPRPNQAISLHVYPPNQRFYFAETPVTLLYRVGGPVEGLVASPSDPARHGSTLARHVSTRVLPAHAALKFLTQITHEERSRSFPETDVRPLPYIFTFTPCCVVRAVLRHTTPASVFYAVKRVQLCAATLPTSCWPTASQRQSRGQQRQWSAGWLGRPKRTG